VSSPVDRSSQPPPRPARPDGRQPLCPSVLSGRHAVGKSHEIAHPPPRVALFLSAPAGGCAASTRRQCATHTAGQEVGARTLAAAQTGRQARIRARVSSQRQLQLAVASMDSCPHPLSPQSSPHPSRCTTALQKSSTYVDRHSASRVADTAIVHRAACEHMSRIPYWSPL